MIAGWVAILTALAYLCGLFAVAHFGDTKGRRFVGRRLRPLIYALTLCVYCTSWTFFGSVGLASSRGLDFVPVYLGPLIVLGLGHRFILRILRLAKAQNITSIADFVAARYGKSQPVAALVATIAVIGAVPYIALQLKAISNSLTTVLGSTEPAGALFVGTGVGDLSLFVALLLAGFAMAFGTRRIDATEHQDGLLLAIATESLVKLVAFLAVGAFVTWSMFGGFTDLAQRASENVDIRSMLAQIPDVEGWTVTTLLSGCCILLLPRQFHVAIVENRDESDVKTATWLVPVYLVAINVFVVPLAIAGLLIFPGGSIDRDMTVLALPLQAHSGPIALLAMIGGLSAATAMVVVESVALAIMVSNDLVMPLVLRGRGARQQMALMPDAPVQEGDLGALVLIVRRVAIVFILCLSYVYFKQSSEAALAAIGLLSFAAITQIAPACFGGLLWRRANARGAMAGLVAGTLVWAYTLLMPSLENTSPAIAALVADGPLGLAALKPGALFLGDWPPLVHGVMLSLAANVLAFVGFSLTRHPTPIERLQAGLFVGAEPAPMGQVFRLWRASVTVGELERTIARYLGADSTRRAFESFRAMRGVETTGSAEADIHILRFAEHLLASAIGTASSRLVLSLLLHRRNVSREAALRLVDDASSMLKYNRDLLQHALDFARQGITVFDQNLRLICWNREFRDLFDLPADKLHLGMGLEEVVRFNAERGLYGPGTADDFIAARLELLVNESEPVRLKLQPGGVIEIRSARMPDGGIVTTYTDVTRTVKAEEALEATNETLEQRVRERTEELVRLNAELARAKAQADEANVSKTRFLAAASHDILQPLNAARLYATSLVERTEGATERSGGAIANGRETTDLTRNLDASLEAVEDILSALLEISRLDAGAMKPEFSNFRIDEIFSQLRIEFEPLAREKNLTLVFVPSSMSVRSDRRLLSRLLQNLVSNALKYTQKGRVLVGCRRRAGKLSVEIYDTGLGIPKSKQKEIFREFARLASAAKTARGLGLGLSIVERLSRVLGHAVTLRSQPGRGSVFAVAVPIAEPAAALQRPNPSAPGQHRPLAGMKVLALDNDERILAGMQILLEGWGCRVVTAADWQGAEAVPPQARIVPDVVIADYHLDASDGIAAIAAARAEFGASLPALLITADRGQRLRERAAEHAIPVLHKPLKPAVLRALLSQWRVMRPAAE